MDESYVDNVDYLRKSLRQKFIGKNQRRLPKEI